MMHTHTQMCVCEFVCVWEVCVCVGGVWLCVCAHMHVHKHTHARVCTCTMKHIHTQVTLGVWAGVPATLLRPLSQATLVLHIDYNWVCPTNSQFPNQEYGCYL